MLEIHINHGELVFTTKYYPSDVTKTELSYGYRNARCSSGELKKMDVQYNNKKNKIKMEEQCYEKFSVCDHR